VVTHYTQIRVYIGGISFPGAAIKPLPRETYHIYNLLIAMHGGWRAWLLRLWVNSDVVIL